MKIIIGIIIVIAVVLVGYNILRGPTTEEPIKIGLSSPMTGEAASLGEGFSAGAQFAVKEINDAGGIKGRKIELIIEDDQCSSRGVNAITKLVEIDKVTAIVGPLCSAAAGPGLPVAQKAGVPVLVVGSAPHLTKIGDYIFRNYPSDAFQGKFAAEYIFNTLNKKKVAVMYTNNDWGAGINGVFVERFKQLGGQVLYDEAVTQDSSDLRTVIAKAKATKPEVIYFPAYPTNGVAGLKQMKELGITVPIIGGDGFDAEEIWRVPEAEGLLYTVAKTNYPEEFQKRVKAATGKEANVIYTAYAYDAVKIFEAVIGKVGTDRKAIRDELARTIYKEAIAVPVVEFDEQGDLKEATFEVRVVKNGKPETYSP